MLLTTDRADLVSAAATAARALLKVDWNPAEHPRDPLGRFIEVLAGDVRPGDILAGGFGAKDTKVTGVTRSGPGEAIPGSTPGVRIETAYARRGGFNRPRGGHFKPDQKVRIRPRRDVSDAIAAGHVAAGSPEPPPKKKMRIRLLNQGQSSRGQFTADLEVDGRVVGKVERGFSRGRHAGDYKAKIGTTTHAEASSKAKLMAELRDPEIQAEMRDAIELEGLADPITPGVDPRLFRMSAKELRAEGTPEAQGELDRRAAKRAAKRGTKPKQRVPGASPFDDPERVARRKRMREKRMAAAEDAERRRAAQRERPSSAREAVEEGKRRAAEGADLPVEKAQIGDILIGHDGKVWRVTNTSVYAGGSRTTGRRTSGVSVRPLSGGRARAMGFHHFVARRETPESPKREPERSGKDRPGISRHLHGTKRTTDDLVKSVSGTIAKVHDVPDGLMPPDRPELRVTPPTAAISARSGADGAIARNKREPTVPVSMEIRDAPSLGTPEGNLAHEIGHFLDLRMFDGEFRPPRYDSAFASNSGKAFEGVLRAANESPSIAQMNADKAKQIGSGRVARHNRKVYGYLLSNHEIVARAYAQWIATRAGDERMLNGIRRDQIDNPMYVWPDGEFEPIAKELDKVFEKWLTTSSA